jgi:hypothetical protein
MIVTPRGFDLVGIRSEHYRTRPNLDAAPFSSHQNALSSDDDADRAIPMTVPLYVYRHTARYRPRHPVWRQPSAGEFGNPDGHALTAEAVWYSANGGRNHLGVLVGVAADLVLAAVDLAAEDCALQQDVFEAKAKAVPALEIRWLGQLKLGVLNTECPFQRLLNRHGPLRAARPKMPSACMQIAIVFHLIPRSRRRSAVTSPRANIASRMEFEIALTGR